MRQPDWQTEDGRVRLYCGDCLDSLRQMSDGSINCCVTSPPYWGLRDYGTAEWEGGDVECEHVGEAARTSPAGSAKQASNQGAIGVASGDCGKCGAKRIDRQLGLEKTPEEYVAKMVDVFREVRRVLRDDGTCWLNLGDSYNGIGGPGKQNGGPIGLTAAVAIEGTKGRRIAGLKPKDLVGIPWRVAFALQADGWWLRQDIIWHKPNPMPESVTDRCTKAHEYIFLLAKSERYYYDNDSIREPSEGTDPRLKRSPYDVANGAMRNSDMEKFGTTRGKVNQPCCNPLGRNRRSVWTVSTKPYKQAHFATFPPDLIEPCILAGCPEDGIVLDPFNGSGTTGQVCVERGRQCVGLELNPAYVELAKQRIGSAVRRSAKPLFEAKPKYVTRDLFDENH